LSKKEFERRCDMNKGIGTTIAITVVVALIASLVTVALIDKNFALSPYVASVASSSVVYTIWNSDGNSCGRDTLIYSGFAASQILIVDHDREGLFLSEMASTICVVDKGGTDTREFESVFITGTGNNMVRTYGRIPCAVCLRK